MRILIIEDNQRSREYLAKGLTESGFVCDVAADGPKGLEMALENEHDLILLDVMLPGMDGWQVIRALRAKGKSTPTLFLTAKDTISDRVRGFDLGADDYLVKPFAWAELLARVRNLLRRGPQKMPEILRVGDLELDLPKMKAWRAGQSIELTAKEFQLLALFAKRRGEVLSRQFIAEEIWEMHSANDSNAIDVAIGRLRRKVDEPFATRLIHTHRGLGYVVEDHADG
jgi:two-component system copper resistance phosphate regulon response regulator CusR